MNVDPGVFRQCEDSGHPPASDDSCHCGYRVFPERAKLIETFGPIGGIPNDEEFGQGDFEYGDLERVVRAVARIARAAA